MSKFAYEHNFAGDEPFFTADYYAPVPRLSDFNPFSIDVIATEEAFTVKANLSGFDKDEIKVGFENTYLTISASKDETIGLDYYPFLRQERNMGDLTRRFFLEDIDKKMIHTTLKNGILTVNCPKK